MIRKAVQADLDAVVRIYEEILTEEEAGRAKIGWVRGIYPTRKTAKEALAAGSLYVLEDGGEIRAAAKIDGNQVPEYADCKWESEAEEEEVLVLHTLVVSPSCAGKGYGTAFVHFYEEQAREQERPYLRMDTNEKNQAARRLYQRLGYREAGIVDCNFNGIAGVRLVCLEKRV